MNERYLWVFISGVLLASCQSGQTRSIFLNENVKAEGRISADTVFDGPIKFFDAKTNRLLEECDYLHGVRSGTGTMFNENGTVRSKANFIDGKQNGFSYHYDENGKLVQKSYNYYGIHVGASIHYSNDSVKQFFFYDMDENPLVHLDYDSLKGMELTKIQPELFFGHESYYQPYDFRGEAQTAGNYFLYTPNPPKFNFAYSLVIVDSADKVNRELTRCDSSRAWSIIKIDPTLCGRNERLAVRLQIKDSINDVNITGFHILKY